MAKITKKTTGLSIGTILKAINIKENTPFILNKFYRITDGDGVGALFVGGYSDIELTMHELGDYFEHIETLDDIVELESKVLLIKQIFKQFKELSEDAKEKISHESLINETIAFLAQDEVYQCDEIELQFICANMDNTIVGICSCCGKFILPDDECYGDELNDGAALCDHCSVYDDDRNKYIKSVHQDVIEKITGLKFSPHIGNVSSTVEEFNHWLNRYKLAFSYSEELSKQNFLDFINGCTEFNICDCCGLIEKSNNLKWITSEDFVEDENIGANFALATLNVDALCEICMDTIIKRTKLDLHEVVQRIRENQMVYRVGDLVVLENVNFDEKKTSLKTYIDYIVSIDENKKTYKLKEYGDIEFNEDDFFDIANEAYVSEYTKFIASQHPDLSEDVNQWSNITHEGIPEIEMAFEEFGFKDEFIEHLKTNDLPYGRLLTPKFKIGDTFTVHFAYYAKDEVTTHTIVDIDTSFTEANEIVYWDNSYVYICESQLEKQKIQSLIIDEIDEVQIIKDDLLHNLFCLDEENEIVVPTFTELEEAKELLPKWQLCEKYEDYSYDSVINEINEQCENFFISLEALNTEKEKFRKSKKYGFRETVEFGAPIEIIEVLQNLHQIYSEKELDGTEMVFLQANISTQDYSTIEVVLQCDINESELSHYLKSNVEKEHHDEVDMLLEAIKQAKADKHESLHVYDC